MTRMKLSVAVALLLGGAFLHAQTSNAPLPPSCQLVTKADVQQAIGTPVADPAPNRGNPALCDFAVSSGGTVSFLKQPAGSLQNPDKFLAEAQKHKLSPEAAPGIGDRSYFTSPGYGMVQLNTFKGSTYIVITMLVPGATPAKQKAALETLMKKALAKP